MALQRDAWLLALGLLGTATVLISSSVTVFWHKSWALSLLTVVVGGVLLLWGGIGIIGLSLQWLNRYIYPFERPPQFAATSGNKVSQMIYNCEFLISRSSVATFLYSICRVKNLIGFNSYPISPVLPP